MVERWRSENARLMNFDRTDTDTSEDMYVAVGAWLAKKEGKFGERIRVLGIQGDTLIVTVVYVVDKE
jgi:hypothetical protein